LGHLVSPVEQAGYVEAHEGGGNHAEVGEGGVTAADVGVGLEDATEAVLFGQFLQGGVGVGDGDEVFTGRIAFGLADEGMEMFRLLPPMPRRTTFW
jgi:hypothetical protein